MCGFVACLTTTGGLAFDAVRRALPSIIHRGPDDSGIWHDGPVALGFRRLSILDLSAAGHQPMSTEDGQCTLVFNGEIYNFVELRAELEALGHRFRSHGDTEVLLASYRQWGTDCVKHFNGMWAFVLYDRSRGVLFGSRDRFGMKPLFRHRQGGHAIFASEIKAIRVSGLYRDELDLNTCAEYLYAGQLDCGTRSFWRGIERVPPAHSFELTLDGRYRQWRYWDLTSLPYRDPLPPDEAFARAFDGAMRQHMRSDVPVGVNLSGGLDSTSILCAASRLKAETGSTEPLLAFCYQDSSFDESRYVAETLAQTGARIVPLQLTPQQLWDSLPDVLAKQDEPVHTMTAVVGYHLMSLARSHGVKVVLNGQGADEVIGGYGSYFHERWAEMLRSGLWRAAREEISAYTGAHGGDARRLLRRAIRHALQSTLTGSRAYRGLADRRQLAKLARSDWIRPELGAHLSAERFRPPFGLQASLASSVQRDPLPLYLRIEDRNAMAHSVEARLPFLDRGLVELVFSMGPEWKVRGPWNKYVLRQGLRGMIPESVRTRVDKMGFPTDMGNWLRGPLHDRVLGVLHDPGFRQNPMFDAAALTAALEQHRSGQSDRSGRLFAAVQFHLWQQAAAGATERVLPS